MAPMKTKAEWAAGKAAELRRQAAALEAEKIGGEDWRRRQAVAASARELRAKAARFDRMARKNAA